MIKSKIACFALALLTIYSVVMLTACPSRTDLESAERHSKKLAGLSDVAGETTIKLFNERIISLEKKNRIADAFIKVSKAGVKFDQAVILAQANWGDKPPQPTLDELFAILDDEVVAYFLAAVEELSGFDTSPYRAVIGNIKAAILVIAKVFGKGKTEVIQSRLAVVGG